MYHWFGSALLFLMFPVLGFAQSPASEPSTPVSVESPSTASTSPDGSLAEPIPQTDEQRLTRLYRPRTVTTNLDLTYYRVKVGSLSMIQKLDPARQTAVLEMHNAVNINVLFLTYKRRSDVVANFNADGLLSFTTKVTEDDDRATALTGRLDTASDEMVIEGTVEDKPFTARVPRGTYRFTSVESYPYLGAMLGRRETFPMLNLETGLVEPATVEDLGREDCPSDVDGRCLKVRRLVADGSGEFLYTPDGQLVYGSGEDKRGSYTMRFASTESALEPLPENQEGSLTRFWSFIKKMGTPPEETVPAEGTPAPLVAPAPNQQAPQETNTTTP